MPTRPPQHRPAGWKPAPPTKRPESRDPFYGSRQWRRTAARVIARDGGLCRVCGKPGADTAHHLRERRAGGDESDANLVAVHRACHHRLHPEKGRRV